MIDKKTLSNTKYLHSIIKSPVYQISQITPLQKMEHTSKRFENTILVKREDYHIINSFKIRGAYSMIFDIYSKKKIYGVITASAGNHAQGVAFSANKLNIKSIIVMPIFTSLIKINSVKSFGAKIILFGKNFDEAKKKAIILSKKYGYTFIPPFDHPMIISGQGTIGMELINQDNNLDKIFIPVGGGGLIAGIAILIKQLMPKIKIIAVESEGSACLYESLKIGKPINLKKVDLFAEGVAVKQIGYENFRICKLYLDDIITVNNDAICSAIKDLFEDNKAIAEPSGALALAGLKKYIKKNNIKNERLVHILSGSNINFHRLRYISESCELEEQKEILLAIKIKEGIGNFLDFCILIGNRIFTEFSYRYSEEKYARIFIGIKLNQGINEKKQIISLIKKYNYDLIDLSNNEIAKLHIRYMIGGKILKKNFSEKLYHFMFPEFKGSLLKFLKKLGNQWNITLFHYRNYGTEYGKVLAGFNINTKKQQTLFEKYLNNLGYEYSEETNNSSFNFFLSI